MKSSDQSLRVSKEYKSRIDWLTRAMGYPDSAKGLEALADMLRKEDALFFPETILEKFADTPTDYTEEARASMKSILRAGIFNDAGVEAYAAPVTPLAFGLFELAAQAHRSRMDMRYVIGCADISNLGGLNQALPNRARADMILAHLALLPQDAMQEWEAIHGYRVQMMAVRTGGDEFKYLAQIKTRDGSAINDTDLTKQLNELVESIDSNAAAFAKKTGIDHIAHYKVGRAPGVGTTVTMRIVNPQMPNLIQTIHGMGVDIAEKRKTRDAAYVPSQTPQLLYLKPPKKLPPSYHRVDATTPYDQTALTPERGESLERFSLRMALEKGGFQELAQRADLLSYYPSRRRSDINHLNEEFKTLRPEDQKAISRLVEVERMRGLTDPVTRCYSSAYFNECVDYAKSQGHTKVMEVDMKNLPGLNLLSEPMADAVLREVGKVIDGAYRDAMHYKQKPLVARSAGSVFTIFMPGDTPQPAIKKLKTALTEGIENINAIPIKNFTSQVKLSSINTHGYTKIGDIKAIKPYPAEMKIPDHGIALTFSERSLEQDLSRQNSR